MNTNFTVIGLTRLGIKSKGTAPEADALTTRPSELSVSASKNLKAYTCATTVAYAVSMRDCIVNMNNTLRLNISSIDKQQNAVKQVFLEKRRLTDNWAPDNWALGQLGTRTTGHQNNLAPGQLGTKTIEHQDNWAQLSGVQLSGAQLFWCPVVWCPIVLPSKKH